MIAAILVVLVPAVIFGASPPGALVRVALLSPPEVAWRMHIIAHHPGGKQTELFAGKDAGATATQGGWMQAQQSDWIELTSLLGKDVPSVRFLFETKPGPEGRGVEARFEVATAANEAAIVRSITEHDPGNVISLRLPADISRDAKRRSEFQGEGPRRV